MDATLALCRLMCVLLSTVTYFASGAKPTETTLSLIKAPGDPSTLGIGMKSTMTLEAIFHESTTGVVIELLPSVNETVLAVGNVVSKTKGSELDISEGQWDSETLHPGKEYSTSDAVLYSSRGVFTLGNVNIVSGTSTDEADYKVTIVYEVVMTSVGSYGEGDAFMTSSGMEYGDYIWISQDSFTLTQAVATLPDEPSVTSQDVSTITIGEPLAVDVTIRIPYVQSTLKIEALEMDDTKDIFVTRIRLKSASEAYAYQINFAKNEVIQHECPLKTSGELQIGPLINKESQTSNPDPASYDIVVEITFLSRATQDIVNNQYTIGIGVDINSDEIWVTSFVLTAIATNLPELGAGAVQIQPDDVPAVSPGFVEEVAVDIEMPETFEKQITVDLTTVPLNGAQPALSLISVRQTFRGTNIQCDISEPIVTLTSSITDGPTDAGVYTFILSNYGFNDEEGTDKNKLTLAVTFMVIMDQSINENDQHKLTINVASTGIQEKTITIGADQPFPDSVDYDFQLTNKCPTNMFESGSSIEFDVIVTTQRNVTGGPMVIEVPIPSTLTSSNLKFCGAKIKDVGENVLCAQEGNIQSVTMSSWLDDGIDDHAVLFLENMCNRQKVDNVTEDQFTISITVQVRDTYEILSGALIVNETFGIGINYSNTQLWVASYDIQIYSPTVFSEIDYVDTLYIRSEDLVDAQPAPSLALQWSPDGTAFYDLPLQYNVPTISGSDTVFELTTSLVTKYIRLTDKTCTAGCRPTHSFVTESGVNHLKVPYGTTTKKDLLKSNLMFARDLNNDTCFDLPTKSNAVDLPALLAVFTDTRITAAHTMTVIGKGITCNSTSGPQVTIPMYGLSASPLESDGLGKTGECRFLSEENNTPFKTCNYQCDCKADGCNTIGLFMIHKEDTPPTPYQLCEIIY